MWLHVLQGQKGSIHGIKGKDREDSLRMFPPSNPSPSLTQTLPAIFFQFCLVALTFNTDHAHCLWSSLQDLFPLVKDSSYKAETATTQGLRAR